MSGYASSLGGFNVQELAPVSRHRVPFRQGPDGADVPQSLVKRKQLGGEVEGGEAAAGAAQATLLLTGLGGNPAPQQSVRLH